MTLTRTFNVARNLRLLYALGLARDFTPMLVVWVLYLTDFRNLTLTRVAIMEGLFWLVKLVLELPSGAFADRFGRKATFIVGLSLEATGTLVFAFSGGFALLIVSYVVWSSGLAFRSGNDGAFLFETLSTGDRESEYSDRFGRYHALSTISILIGGLLGGVLAEVTTLQIAVLASVAPFCVALPIALMMQEPPRHTSELGHLSIIGTLRTGLREVWRTPSIRSIVLLEVALTGSFPAFFLLSQPFLDHHGVPLALFGLILVPVQLCQAAAGVFAGAIVRRFGVATTLTAAVSGVVLGLTTIAVIDHPAALAGLALSMSSTGIAMPAIGGFINERTASRVRATVLSVAPLGTSLMLALMSMAAGVMAAGSLRVSYGVMAIAIALAGGGALIAFLNSRSTYVPDADAVALST